MLNAHSFMDELGSFFSVSGSEKDKAERFDKYATLLIEEINTKYHGRYNYDKLLKYLELTCDRFPSIKEIIANLPIGVEQSYSGKEGQTIKRVWQGHEYEFTIVPNHWDCMTISELDNDIKRRSANANTGAESF